MNIELDQETSVATPELQSVRTTMTEFNRDMAEGAGLATDYIVDINKRTYLLKNQPAGVFILIMNVVNGSMSRFTEVITTDEAAAMKILKVMEGVDTPSANAIKKKAIDDTMGSLPKIIGAMATILPEAIAEIVSLILEPFPEKLRRGEKPTFSKEQILWDIPSDQLVKAVCWYIESLQMGELKKKVALLR